MKTLTHIAAAFSAIALGLGMSACNDDEATTPVLPTQKLEAPAVSHDASTAYTLAFSWQPVANASQYAYRLLAPNGEAVDGGVTQGMSALFSDLDHSTAYTFSVQAMPTVYNSQYIGSEPATVSASTLVVKKLDSPTVKARVQGMTCTVSWTEVENADYYSYTYGDGTGYDVENTTTDLSVLIRSLSRNEYTFTLQAMSYDELFGPSDPVTITFKR